MSEYQPQRRSFTRLGIVALLGLVYAGIFILRPLLLGQPLLGGSLGVLLGLYICSHPAANAIDLLFFGRVGRYIEYTPQQETIWLIVNGAVMLVGLIVIIIGATRFSVPSR